MSIAASAVDTPAPLPARALAALSSHLSTELLLLARIHYKNNSQHRLALFWRRVHEIKRLGTKVQSGWSAWQTRSHELVEAHGSKKGREGELRRLGTLLDKLHGALPKLHESLHQLVLLTHFLPLVTVLLGITARLWGLSAGMHDHLRGVWAREHPTKRPWRTLDGTQVSTKLLADTLATRRTPTESVDVSLSDTPASSRRVSPSPAVVKASPRPPPEHGEVIQRKPALPTTSASLGTVVARELVAKPSPAPSILDDEPITYADSDSDSEPAPRPEPSSNASRPLTSASPPPQPDPSVATKPFLPFLHTSTAVLPPSPKQLSTTTSSKPLKRPSPAALPSTAILPVAKRPKFEDGRSKSSDSAKKIKVKKKKRDELDDIFG